MDEKKFHQWHCKHREEAILQYDVEKQRFGCDEFEEDYKKMLLEKIDAVYKCFSEINNSRDASYFLKQSAIAGGVCASSGIASAALISAESAAIAVTGAVAFPVAIAAGAAASCYFLYGTYKYLTQVRA